MKEIDYKEIELKYNKIINLYTRNYRQEDIARKFNIPVKVVQKVTKIGGYSHGKKITFENRNTNQLVPIVIDLNELAFLLKYEF